MAVSRQPHAPQPHGVRGHARGCRPHRARRTLTMTEQDHDKSGLSEEDNIEIATRLRNDGTIDSNLVSGRIDTLPRLTSYMPGMAALSPL